MPGFLDVCRFNPALGGTTDWTYSTIVQGYQSPTAAGAVNGTVYRYRAESADLSQWEIGYGAYNSGTGVFARAVVLFNSSGTTAKINFSTVPQVAIVAVAEDLTAIVLRSYLAGLTLSTAGSSATFSVAAGVAADSTNADMMTLSGSISKTTSSWTAGSGNGALDTGAIANNTWYHAYLIKRTDTQIVDVLISLDCRCRPVEHQRSLLANRHTPAGRNRRRHERPQDQPRRHRPHPGGGKSNPDRRKGAR
jgi:hypothetical protein